MKASFLFRAFLLATGLLFALGRVQAQDAFKVLSIRQTFSGDLIKVGKDWRKDLPRRIQVSLQVQTDTPGASMFIHAYFYDKDGHLVATDNKPNAIWTSTPKGLQEIDMAGDPVGQPGKRRVFRAARGSPGEEVDDGAGSLRE